jgi:hypothetical protein
LSTNKYVKAMNIVVFRGALKQEAFLFVSIRKVLKSIKELESSMKKIDLVFIGEKVKKFFFDIIAKFNTI